MVLRICECRVLFILCDVLSIRGSSESEIHSSSWTEIRLMILQANKKKPIAMAKQFVNATAMGSTEWVNSHLRRFSEENHAVSSSQCGPIKIGETPAHNPKKGGHASDHSSDRLLDKVARRSRKTWVRAQATRPTRTLQAADLALLPCHSERGSTWSRRTVKFLFNTYAKADTGDRTQINTVV